MKKKLLIALGVVAVLILVFVIIVAMQPSEYRITRSATMAAPPNVVFNQVNDFHKWEAWSPWAKLDPAAKNTFDGPLAGTGAKFGWVGNDKVGEGKMEITESKPSERVVIKLDFIKPMEGTSTTEFAFKPEAAGTNVNWTMSGHQSFIEKAFCMFMNMDKMIGGDFEKGLANMKAVAEEEVKK